MSVFEHENRRGGLVELPHATILLGDGELFALEVWHWRWFSVWCNWRNRHRHGWTIVRKRSDGWRQLVLMVRVMPVSPARRRRLAEHEAA